MMTLFQQLKNIVRLPRLRAAVWLRACGCSCFALALGLAVPSISYAQYYINSALSWSFTDNQDADGDSFFSNAELVTENAPAISFSFGKTIDLVPVSFEVEYFRSSFDVDIATKVLSSTVNTYDSRAQVSALTVGAYYNIPVNEQFTLNAGLAVGRGWVDYSSDDVAISNEKGRMAWHGRLGAMWDQSERNSLSAGLRYTRISDVQFEIADQDYASHYGSWGLELGWRYKFMQ